MGHRECIEVPLAGGENNRCLQDVAGRSATAGGSSAERHARAWPWSASKLYVSGA